MYFFERYTSELSSFLLESSTLTPKYPNNKNDANNKTKFLSIAIKVEYKVHNLLVMSKKLLHSS
jgi:hypothetical protein